MTDSTAGAAKDELEQLLEWRSQFPILDSSTYMISNSLGAMPRRVTEDLAAYAETWASRGVRAWEEGWWDMAVTLGDTLAPIIGAGPGEVGMVTNVSGAEATILSSLKPTPKRNKVVFSELNFPSVRYLYQAQPELEVVAIPSPDGIHIPLELLLEAIDEQTLVVPFSHVIFKSSYIQDASAIIEKAHSVGAVVIMDAYQSCGTVPFDVKELDVDFLVGGSLKWLCGGPGSAYLYVKPELREQLEPRITGWMAHASPFDFDPVMDYASGGFRFLGGTPPVPALYAASAGYQIIAEIGVESIRQKSMAMTKRILGWADEFGFQVNTPRKAEERGGAVSINPPRAEEVCRQLLERNILVDFRPGAGIRFSPHFYNSAQEIDHALDTLNSLVREGPSD